MKDKEKARVGSAGISQIYENIIDVNTPTSNIQTKYTHDDLAPLIKRMRTGVSAKKGVKFGIDQTPLTKQQIQDHLNNKCRRGLYYIEPGASFCRVACFDLDDHEDKFTFEEILKRGEEIVDIALKHGLKANAFTSSSGHGLHLYFLWNTNQDAYSVRELLADIMAEAGYEGRGNNFSRDGFKIERFSKQNSVPLLPNKETYGNYTFLPLSKKSHPVADVELVGFTTVNAKPVWNTSKPVALRKKPKVQHKDYVAPTDLEEIENALYALDPSMEHDQGWLNVGMALHHATQGSSEIKKDGSLQILATSQRHCRIKMPQASNCDGTRLRMS